MSEENIYYCYAGDFPSEEPEAEFFTGVRFHPLSLLALLVLYEIESQNYREAEHHMKFVSVYTDQESDENTSEEPSRESKHFRKTDLQVKEEHSYVSNENVGTEPGTSKKRASSTVPWSNEGIPKKTQKIKDEKPKFDYRSTFMLRDQNTFRRPEKSPETLRILEKYEKLFRKRARARNNAERARNNLPPTGYPVYKVRIYKNNEEGYRWIAVELIYVDDEYESDEQEQPVDLSHARNPEEEYEKNNKPEGKEAKVEANYDYVERSTLKEPTAGNYSDKIEIFKLSEDFERLFSKQNVFEPMVKRQNYPIERTEQSLDVPACNYSVFDANNEEAISISSTEDADFPCRQPGFSENNVQSLKNTPVTEQPLDFSTHSNKNCFLCFPVSPISISSGDSFEDVQILTPEPQEIINISDDSMNAVSELRGENFSDMRHSPENTESNQPLEPLSTSDDSEKINKDETSNASSKSGDENTENEQTNASEIQSETDENNQESSGFHADFNNSLEVNEDTTSQSSSSTSESSDEDSEVTTTTNPQQEKNFEKSKSSDEEMDIEFQVNKVGVSHFSRSTSQSSDDNSEFTTSANPQQEKNFEKTKFSDDEVEIEVEVNKDEVSHSPRYDTESDDENSKVITSPQKENQTRSSDEESEIDVEIKEDEVSHSSRSTLESSDKNTEIPREENDFTQTDSSEDERKFEVANSDKNNEQPFEFHAGCGDPLEVTQDETSSTSSVLESRYEYQQESLGEVELEVDVENVDENNHRLLEILNSFNCPVEAKTRSSSSSVLESSNEGSEIITYPQSESSDEERENLDDHNRHSDKDKASHSSQSDLESSRENSEIDGHPERRNNYIESLEEEEEEELDVENEAENNNQTLEVNEDNTSQASRSALPLSEYKLEDNRSSSECSSKRSLRSDSSDTSAVANEDQSHSLGDISPGTKEDIDDICPGQLENSFDIPKLLEEGCNDYVDDPVQADILTSYDHLSEDTFHSLPSALRSSNVESNAPDSTGLVDSSPQGQHSFCGFLRLSDGKEPNLTKEEQEAELNATKQSNNTTKDNQRENHCFQSKSKRSDREEEDFIHQSHDFSLSELIEKQLDDEFDFADFQEPQLDMVSMPSPYNESMEAIHDSCSKLYPKYALLNEYRRFNLGMFEEFGQYKIPEARKSYFRKPLKTLTGNDLIHQNESRKLSDDEVEKDDQGSNLNESIVSGLIEEEQVVEENYLQSPRELLDMPDLLESPIHEVYPDESHVLEAAYKNNCLEGEQNCESNEGESALSARTDKEKDPNQEVYPDESHLLDTASSSFLNEEQHYESNEGGSTQTDSTDEDKKEEKTGEDPVVFYVFTYYKQTRDNYQVISVRRHFNLEEPEILAEVSETPPDFNNF